MNIYAYDIIRTFRNDTQRYDDPADQDHDTFESFNFGGGVLPELR